MLVFNAAYRNDMLLSICIPSYNRGQRALSLVKQLLAMDYGDAIEVIISNNGSVKNVEGYEQIEKIQDKRLHYHKFAENQQYWGNFNQVVKMSQGDFCLLISDEDEIIEEGLEHYLKLLKEHPPYSVIRSATSQQYKVVGGFHAKAGMQAIQIFYMQGNYISGIIYNRHVVTNELIDCYAEKFEGNSGYFYYPHLFVDAYALLKGDLYLDSVLLIRQGEPEQDQETDDISAKQKIVKYATHGSRLEQMQGFIEQIGLLEVSDEIKLQMFIILCNQTIRLINGLKNVYLAEGIDWEKVLEDAKTQMKQMIESSKIPVFIKNKEALQLYVDSWGKEVIYKEMREISSVIESVEKVVQQYIEISAAERFEIPMEELYDIFSEIWEAIQKMPQAEKEWSDHCQILYRNINRFKHNRIKKDLASDVLDLKEILDNLEDCRNMILEIDHS